MRSQNQSNENPLGCQQVPKELGPAYVRTLKEALATAVERQRRKRLPGPLLLPGLCLPKALSPLLSIYLQGVLQVRLTVHVRTSAAALAAKKCSSSCVFILLFDDDRNVNARSVCGCHFVKRGECRHLGRCTSLTVCRSAHCWKHTRWARWSIASHMYHIGPTLTTLLHADICSRAAVRSCGSWQPRGWARWWPPQARRRCGPLLSRSPVPSSVSSATASPPASR